MKFNWVQNLNYATETNIKTTAKMTKNLLIDLVNNIRTLETVEFVADIMVHLQSLIEDGGLKFTLQEITNEKTGTKLNQWVLTGQDEDVTEELIQNIIDVPFQTEEVCNSYKTYIQDSLLYLHKVNTILKKHNYRLRCFLNEPKESECSKDLCWIQVTA